MWKALLCAAFVLSGVVTVDVFEEPAEMQRKGGKGKGSKKGWKKKDTDEARLPDWHNHDVATIEAAQEAGHPIVIGFLSTKDALSVTYMVDENIARVSREDSTFMLATWGGTITEYADESHVAADGEDRRKASRKRIEKEYSYPEIPAYKLEQDSLWTAYGLADNKETRIYVCDQWGNLHTAFDKTPTSSKLIKAIEDVEDEQKKRIKALKKCLDGATEAWKEKKTADALKDLLKGFEEGLTMVDEAEAAAKLFTEIMDAGRDALKKAIEEKNIKAVKQLARDYKDTSIAEDLTKGEDKIKELIKEERSNG